MSAYHVLKGSLGWIPVGFAVTHLLGSVHRIHGDSMSPTLNPDGVSGDMVLVDRLSIRLFQYHRGDVVLLRSPNDPSRLLVKRLIATEGDWLSVPGGTGSKIIKIPSGRCWVEGDNTSKSEDSLSMFGPVPLALIEGRVAAVFWPPTRLGSIAPPPTPLASRIAARSRPSESSSGWSPWS